MRVIPGEELLGGGDHEFLVNLYVAVLNRMPDEDGYRHYLARIEGRPEERRGVVEEVAASEEAQRLGTTVRFAEAPEPAAAPEELAGAAAEPAAPSGDTPPEEALLARIERLEAELAALRHEATVAVRRQLCDYVNDLLAIEAAHLENRMRLLEKRLLEAEAGAPR
jgi:hypothetical protein